MEWLSRRLGLAFGLTFALAALIAVVSFAPQDPTFTNLRYPKDGIGNWLGYPGALAGGSLVEAFGWAPLLLPCAVLYWLLCTEGRPRWWLYGLQTGTLLMAAAAWTGQWTETPGLGLAGPGLIGWSSGRWTLEMLGAWPGGMLLTAALGLALWHQFYAHSWRATLRDVRALARLFTPRGRQEAWTRLRRGVGNVPWAVVVWALAAPLGAVGWAASAVGGGFHRWILAPAGHVIEALRGSATSLRRIKARAAVAPLLRPAARATFTSRSEESEKAFDAWMESDPFPEDGTPLAARDAASPPPGGASFETRPIRTAPQPPAPTGAERLPEPSRVARASQSASFAPPLPAAGSGPERWEQLLRRYRENLDLDWEERRWRTKPDGEENAPGSQAPRPQKR